MKTSNTIVAFCLALAASFLALAAGSSAAPAENPGPNELYHPHSKKHMPKFSLRAHRTLEARNPQPTNSSPTAGPPVENTAAPAKNTGPKDLSHPHWKKPIPIFSQRSHRTLEATRTIQARDDPTVAPDPTVGPGGVTSLPSDVTYSFGAGYHFSSVKAHTPIGWLPPFATYMPPPPPMPTTPVCDGLGHPEQYSYEKCMVAIRKYEDDTKRRSDDWKLLMENAKAATEEVAKKYKEEEEERKKEEKEKTKKRLDEERRVREEVENKKEEAEKKKKKEAQERVAEEDEREAKVEVEKKKEEEEKKKRKKEEEKKKEEEEKKEGKNVGWH